MEGKQKKQAKPTTPYFEVVSPEGQHFQVLLPLLKTRFTIGRYEAVNDVALRPDPQQLVSRQVHCLVEHRTQGWWLTDNDSVNGTFLMRLASLQKIRSILLQEGDIIYILGKLLEEQKSEPQYRQLTFFDPQGTNKTVEFPDEIIDSNLSTEHCPVPSPQQSVSHPRGRRTGDKKSNKILYSI